MSLKIGHEKCIIPGCSATNKSLHSLPKERNLADKWMDFIFGDQNQPIQSQSFRVCTGHFTPECIQNQGLYDAGVVSKLLLKKGSIPTISDPSQNIKTVTAGSSSKILPAVRHVACQTDLPLSAGTQVYMKTYLRSKGTQARVASRDCGMCTLTFPLDSPLLFLQPTIIKRPSKRPRLSLTDKEEGPSQCKLSLLVHEPENST
ncbi:uncharacterized protein LOC115567202 isoform X3 [Sparus aurata]|uniref:uncharacterized protein LOC115567202 isoform X3 n=1 Tax=Sparus aurata TaxID=8175 RepID=UPI0011C0E98A|nr:uncharacterized protein LOC115567202 isoform X3 [Sparus aurata]